MALNASEARFLQHMTRWGSDGYGAVIVKRGRHWWWDEAFGIKWPGTPYKTKKAAYKAVETYCLMLCDKHAGRL